MCAMHYGGNFPVQDDEISLAEWGLKAQGAIRCLWKWKFLILGVRMLFAVGGFLRVFLSKPQYTASLTLALEQGGLAN